MNIGFIVPDLVGTGGHAFEWTDLLARACLQRHGAQVAVYGHADTAPSVRQGLDDRLAYCSPFRGKPYVGARRAMLPGYPRFHAAAYQSALARQLSVLPTDADLWIVPTLFPSTLKALLALPGRPPVAALVHLGPHEYPGEAWQQAWRRAAAQGGVHLHATTPRVQEAFRALGIPADCLPYIHSAGQAPPAPRPALQTVGLLGQQRREKRMDTRNAVVNALLEDGLQVILQDSLGQSAERSADPPGLTRVGFVPDFGALVSRCDLVITPYDAARYRFRMSGVAIDALARGVPVAVPADSHAGDVVRYHGAGEAMSGSSVRDIIDAARAVGSNFGSYAGGALAAARWLGQAHGAGRASDALLASVDATPASS